jgi:hypothetical protein
LKKLKVMKIIPTNDIEQKMFGLIMPTKVIKNDQYHKHCCHSYNTSNQNAYTILQTNLLVDLKGKGHFVKYHFVENHNDDRKILG